MSVERNINLSNVKIQVVIGTDRNELRDGLRALAEGQQHPTTITGETTDGKLAFLFTGQGAQRLGMGMGRELYDAVLVFAEALDAVLERFDTPVREVMWGEDADARNLTGNAQLALFVFETALYRLLESLDVRPDYLAGHSLGEITAAHASGILTLDDACTLVTARARLMQSLPPGGTMTTLRATEHEVLPHLSEDHGTVAIAAVNTADSLVISGTTAAVDAITARFLDCALPHLGDGASRRSAPARSGLRRAPARSSGCAAYWTASAPGSPNARAGVRPDRDVRAGNGARRPRDAAVSRLVPAPAQSSAAGLAGSPRSTFRLTLSGNSARCRMRRGTMPSGNLLRSSRAGTTGAVCSPVCKTASSVVPSIRTGTVTASVTPGSSRIASSTSASSTRSPCTWTWTWESERPR